MVNTKLFTRSHSIVQCVIFKYMRFNSLIIGTSIKQLSEIFYGLSKSIYSCWPIVILHVKLAHYYKVHILHRLTLHIPTSTSESSIMSWSASRLATLIDQLPCVGKVPWSQIGASYGIFGVHNWYSLLNHEFKNKNFHQNLLALF